jgi:hypothetical protein
MVGYISIGLWTIAVGTFFYMKGFNESYNNLMSLIRDSRDDPQKLNRILDTLIEGIDE